MNNLRYYREKAKISCTELARLVGTNVSTIYRYEHGLREPSAKMAVKLAIAVGCTVEELVADPKGEKTA